MIPYGRQEITEDDIDAVRAVLQSDFLTQGPVGPRFEAAVAARTGTEHGVAATNATAALHLACAAIGLGPGDVLWTQPTTFVASSNAALYCGAEVDFVDIDPRRLTMCPEHLAEKLAVAEHAGRLPKIVMPVHMCGQSADMDAIGALKRRYGFHIVEDASHAIGGRYRDRPVGAFPETDVTVFSFHPVKIVTTGEGGMAVTRDADLATRMALLRSHGITRDPHLMEGEPDGPWAYEQIALGWNYRMTEMQAALGLSQLERLDAYVTRRNGMADRYDALIADLPVTLPWRDPDALSACHLYPVELRDPSLRRGVFTAMRDGGIGVNVHYIPVHLQPWYRRMGFAPGDFPAAESYYAGAITLPLWPGLSDADQDRVVSVLGDAFSAAR